MFAPWRSQKSVRKHRIRLLATHSFHSFVTQVYVKHLKVSPVLLDSEHESYIFTLTRLGSLRTLVIRRVVPEGAMCSY